MQNTGRRKHKGIPISMLQKTTLGNGKTLDFYLMEQPEKFALALCKVLESMNRFTEHKIVYISTKKKPNDVLHVVVDHASSKVDIRGRHKVDIPMLEDLLTEGVTEKDLRFTNFTPSEVLERLEKKENKDKLFEELRDLQVYIKREWLSHSNFYTS